MTGVFQVPGDDEDDWRSPFDLPEPDETDAPASNTISSAERFFGDTAAQPFDQQRSEDTCAIKCQEMILRQFGTSVTEGGLLSEAVEHGWFQAGEGTRSEDVGNLLELHGVAVNRYEQANVFNLTHELAQGHKVMVGVNSSELENSNSILNSIKDALGFSSAGHMVMVSGVDTRDPDHVEVIVSDPATGETAASYPLEQFVNAWEDSDFFLVATQEAAPPHLPEMEFFDYSQGHLSQVAGQNYEEFLEYADRPDAWADEMHNYFDSEAAEESQPWEDTGVETSAPDEDEDATIEADGFELTADEPDDDDPLGDGDPWSGDMSG